MWTRSRRWACRRPAGRSCGGCISATCWSAKTYRRFKANFFRLHRQLVMGNEKRYFYDYYMICCGPLRLETRVLKPETIVGRFTEDGALKIDDQPASSQSR